MEAIVLGEMEALLSVTGVSTAAPHRPQLHTGQHLSQSFPGTEPFTADRGGSLLSAAFPTCPGSHESRPERGKAPRRTLLGDKLEEKADGSPPPSPRRMPTGPACWVNKGWLCLASRPCSCPCLRHRQLFQLLELL